MALDERLFRRSLSRRTALKAGLGALVASQVTMLESLAFAPQRLAMATSSLPDIQFDIGNFIAPAFTENGVMVRFGPVFTLFVPAKLNRTPGKADQAVLANALNTIEANFAFSPSGVFTFVAYGLPYFRRLPSTLVSSRIPSATGIGSGSVLKEAVPSPTDVVSGNGVTKENFQVAVRIEANDVLFTLRSDSLDNLKNVLSWVGGSNTLNGNAVASPNFNGLFSFQTVRLMFQQIGLPRKVANAANLSFAGQINPQSPMWFGFADQQTAASGPAAITTFAGNSSAHLTTARAGDYFDNGSIQTLSHDILDLAQFYHPAPIRPGFIDQPHLPVMKHNFPRQ